MIGRRMISVCAVAVLGIFVMGQDCAAQCDPDPCQGIMNAAPDTCVPVGGGSCAPATDFTCACDPGFDWQDATNTCDALPGGPMVRIPAGCFEMGDHFSEGETSELPVHNVCISYFEMDVHEVTNSEYKACVDDGGCTAPIHSYSYTKPSYFGNPAYDDFPVLYVYWIQATDYCTWAGKRLPTEAEWEYAARGGLEGKRYPWGDTADCDDACYGRDAPSLYCWGHCHNAVCDNDTHPVGNYAPNGYGLYDMAGNVMEFVNDLWNPDYYQYCVDNQIVNDPPGLFSGSTYPHLRGGSWWESWAHRSLRVASRGGPYPDEKYYEVGFRCARGGAYGP